MAEYDVRLAGGDAVLPGVGRVPADICIADGRIRALVARGDPRAEARETVDVSGRVVLPGAVDAHVHLAQDLSAPKSEADVAPETASAVAGGVTSMLAYLMSPQPYETLFGPTRELMEQYAYTDFGFHYCLVTPEQVAAIPRYVKDHGVSTFKFFMNFRGDEGAYLGLPGNDDGFLLDILEAVAANGAMANPHAENIELIWARRGRLQRTPGDGLSVWNDCRPDYAEAEAEQRVAYLASVVQASMYAVHVSSRAALQALVTQRERYDDIFLETCPHYLTLNSSADLGSRGKVNPPLRTPGDQDALWDALRRGAIDVVGSDHVPRHFSAKDKDLWSASAGFPGTGTLLPLLVSEAHQSRGVPLERLVELTATRPARLFGLYPAKGVIAVGADADLTVLDLEQGGTVEAAAQHSGAQYSVWEGWDVRCRVEHTLVRGKFALRDGQLGQASGRYLARPRSGRAALDDSSTWRVT
jgi:dihydropyrimidinase